MQTIVKAMRVIFNKKIFISYISVFILIVLFINLMNPIPTLLKGLYAELSGNRIDNLIVLINSIMNRNTILFYVLLTLAIALGLAVVLSLVFSGLLYILSKTVDDLDFHVKGYEYVKGFLNYFVRLSIILWIILYVSFLLFFSFLIIVFPTLMVGKIAGSNGNGDIAYRFYVIVTSLTCYLLFLFLRIYFIYMIPAAYKTRFFFRVSLKVAGLSFIRSFMTFVLFDLVYIGLISFIESMQSDLYRFLLSFITNTCFWSVAVTWLFFHFNHTIIKKKIDMV